MALIFITGLAGSGKSYLTLALREKGYEAYDTDDDGLARWQHNETRIIHPKSSVKAYMRTQKFISEHSWNVPREYVEELAVKAKDKPVFLLGVMDNEEDLGELFAKKFALIIDEKTLTHRLKARTNNDWGKQPHELEKTLTGAKAAIERWQSLGYTEIEAAQSADRVMAQIIEAAEAA